MRQLGCNRATPRQGRVAAALVRVWGGLLVLLGLGVGLCGAHAQGTPPRLLQMVAWAEEGARLPDGTQDILAGFEPLVPGVRVNLIHDRWPQAPGRLRYWAGSLRDYAPDLTVLHDSWLPQYASALLPLDSYFNAADLAALSPAVLRRCRYKGKLLGVPWQATSRALYYRSDLLETAGLKAPQTLTDLQQAAQKLSHPPQVFGLGLAAAPGGDGAATFLGLLAAAGGKVLDVEGRLQLSSPAAATALEWWVQAARLQATPPEALAWTQEDLLTAFAEGRLAMVFAGPEFGASLRQKRPKLRFATTAPPAQEGSAALLACDVAVVLAGTPRPREAASFLRYLATAPTQRALWMMGGLPTTGALITEARQYANLAPFLHGAEEAQGWPLEHQEVFGRVVDQALWLALSGRCTAPEALDSALKAELARQTPLAGG